MNSGHAGMKFCHECGTALVLRECNDEGQVPYCGTCEVFRFPIYSTAMSTAIFNKGMDKLLLIQQYNRKDYILVAGYINKGEAAEAALVREVKEEVGLDVLSYRYMQSKYFEPSNTLMLNFYCVVDTEDLSHTNHEIDKASWFTIEEAKQQIKKNSLAEIFLLATIDQVARQTLQQSAR